MIKNIPIQIKNNKKEMINPDNQNKIMIIIKLNLFYNNNCIKGENQMNKQKFLLIKWTIKFIK